MKKTLLLTIFCFFSLIACKSEDVGPKTLVGEWSPTDRYQSRNKDGTWGKWYDLIGFTAMPGCKFTNDNRFYLTGSSYYNDCCINGVKYKAIDNKISFLNVASACKSPTCVPEGYIFETNRKDTLVLEENSLRREFYRTK